MIRRLATISPCSRKSLPSSFAICRAGTAFSPVEITAGEDDGGGGGGGVDGNEIIRF